MATAISAWWCSMRTPGSTSGTGAPMATSRTIPILDLTIPDAPLDQQFRNPVHCAELAHDGSLYVCDRANDRIQVFKRRDVRERSIHREEDAGRRVGVGYCVLEGSAAEVSSISQTARTKRFISSTAQSLDILTSFGDGGRQPGEFYAVHSIATDSKGNIYTTETYRGQRVQKFVYKGLGPITTQEEGVLWPKNKK